MSEYVIVRIDEKLIPELQINYNSNTSIASDRDISAWSDIEVKPQHKLILIISANIVFTKQVKIPSKNEEIIRQSIPFALEEFLANDIGDNHYAYWPLSEQNLLVSIIKKSAIEFIQIELESNGLDCKIMMSEVFTVPFHLGKISILSFKNHHIVREDKTGTTVCKKMLKTYIKSSAVDKQIFYTQLDFDLSEFPNAELKKIDTSLLQAMTVTSQESVNLFQAKYSQSDEKAKTKGPLVKIIVLVAAFAISWLAINSYNLWNVSTQIQKVKQEQARLLIELIPNASKTEKRDPYSAVRSRLKISQSNESISGDIGFIQSLHYVGRTLLDHPSIQVQSLRQRGTKLEISVRTQDMGNLNAFQSSLKNNVLEMRVSTGTREVNNDGVSSIITMETMQ